MALRIRAVAIPEVRQERLEIVAKVFVDLREQGGVSGHHILGDIPAQWRRFIRENSENRLSEMGLEFTGISFVNKIDETPRRLGI